MEANNETIHLKYDSSGYRYHPNWANYLIPLVTGISFFLFIYGYQILDVNNIHWLGGGDGLQNYIGWEFFRQTEWNFPVIGLSPNYGMNISSSIVFTDSNPLLSIFFKGLSSLIPDRFQFFGVWLLICCILQSIFSWKILKIYTPSTVICCAGTILFMFIPAWINRVAHINLMAHFLLLAAIYLTLRRKKSKIFEWPLLICLACGIHFYLAMMVMIIWLYNLFSRCIFKEDAPKKIIIELFLTLTLTSITLFVLGYFTVGDVSDRGGFGKYNNNILSPIMTSGWSLLASTNKIGFSPLESMNYWGIGVILLCAISLFLSVRNIKKWKISRRKATLLASCLTFFVIATTNNIEFGRYSFYVPLPYNLLDSLSIFRGSARFFWGITYVAILFSLVAVIRSCNKNTAILIIAPLALLQIIDISKGYSWNDFYFHKNHRSAEVLKNKFWEEGIKSYNAIRFVPFENRGQHWQSLSLVALKNHMPTDAVYMARFSNDKADNMNNTIIHDIVYGKYDAKTVYIIRDDMVNFVHLKKGDKIFKIDGVNVLAPGLTGCQSCKELSFDKGDSYIIFPRDWGVQEPLGSWNGAKKTTVIIYNDHPKNSILIKYKAFTTPKNPTQRLRFKIDNNVVAQEKSNGTGEVQLSWENPPHQKASLLTIETPDAITPRSVGLNSDGRIIGVGIISIEK